MKERGEIDLEKPLSKIFGDFRELEGMCDDLTFLAREGQIEEIYEREKEIKKLIEILGLKTAANPIIVGEAGVGKTSLAKYLAKLIVENKVPEWLKGWKIILTSFMRIWGVTEKDDYWSRYFSLLHQLVDICKKYKILLFMDEFENIPHFPVSKSVILPALSDGSLRLIAAITQKDYRRVIENDEVLNRRFQPVYLEPLSKETTLKVLEKLKNNYEKYYNIEINNEILEEIVELSSLYIHFRFHPAKAINVLEQACVKAKIANRNKMESEHVKLVISEITKVPLEIITSHLGEKFGGIANTLKQRVIGQDEIIEKIAQRLLITLTRSNIEPHRPNGIFLFAGPTGVGKTELAKAISFALTGSEENMVRLDMSLYQNSADIYKLLSSQGPREEPGIPYLTSVIRSRPYTVLLLDEFEKAHPEIWNLFLQVFDYGVLRDLEGNEIYFDNTTIIMTTNVGFSQVEQDKKVGFVQPDERKGMEEKVMKSIQETFSPEFLGRIDEILIFNPLSRELMKNFVKQKIKILEEKIGKKLTLTEAAEEFLAEKGYDPKYGARGLNRTIDKYVGSLIANLKLGEKWDKIEEIKIAVKADGSGLTISE
jgi:ATP-dependent Clp protease ATP-binding subunit ClpA